MDYRYLRAFLATARHRNFSRAAEELRIAQSAVTRQIQLLERNLGFPLLHRTRQTVTVTEQGQRLFEQASRLDDWVKQEFEHQRPLLRLGTLPGLLDTYLIPRLKKLPFLSEMNVRLQVDAQPAVVAMLERDEVDACLVHAQVDRPGIVSRHVRTEEVVVVSTRAIDLTKLETYCWIHMGTAQFLRRASRIPSPHHIVVNSMHAILELVAAGLGIAAVPDYAAAGRRFKIAKLPFRGHIHLAYRQHAVWPARLKDAIQSLAERD